MREFLKYVDESFNYSLHLVMCLLCSFFLHRWEYYEKDRTYNHFNKKLTINFKYRRCKKCGCEMYKDKIAHEPHDTEWNHWHYT